MAPKYNLQPNEVVLLKDEGVMHGGFLSVYTDNLILTNFSLVLLKKGVFGNSKGVLSYPLNQIKVHGDHAQALISKTPNGRDALEVYFLNGQETFSFQTGGKRKLNIWIARINQAVTGNSTPTQENSGLALPGSALIAGVMKDTFGIFKSKLGTNPEVTKKVASTCKGCGAAATGLQGQIVICEYCGSTQQL